MAILMAISVATLLSWLYAALGLGFVIFVHELGHFAVAKWCGVRVERFSIGFGPVIWSFIRGETEYALSAIPFGGYVKMLGQDDVDPNQMTSEDIARDPRSYTAKTVPQRMAIISAGVIMNLITGALFFALAFYVGFQDQPPMVGSAAPGSPAWIAGLQPGDRITRIDGREISSFTHIIQRVMLSWEKIHVEGVHADGTKFEADLVPERKNEGGRPTIGVVDLSDLVVNTEPGPRLGVAIAGTAASQAKPAFAAGDVILAVDGVPVKDFVQFRRIMADRRSEELTVTVARTDAAGNPVEAKLVVPANPFRTLGLHMDIGRIAAVQKGSPADGKLQVGDKITHVIVGEEVREVGKELNSLELPEYLASLHGQAVKIRVRREVTGTEGETVEPELVPVNRPGWIEPEGPDFPLSVPAVGIAYYVSHTVLDVRKNSAAAGKIHPKDTLQSLTLRRVPGSPLDHDPKENIEIKFGETDRNWPYAFWVMQRFPQRSVVLKVSSSQGERTVELQPRAAEDWYAPDRGLVLMPLSELRRSPNAAAALQAGVTETRNFVSDTYLTIHHLATGRIGMKQLHGPVGIAQATAAFASEGLPKLMFFLGYLSINLAVLNFLPIPLLDGGHMVFLIYEGIVRKPASERVLIAATYVGLAFVLILMLFALSNDIFHHLLNVW